VQACALPICQAGDNGDDASGGAAVEAQANAGRRRGGGGRPGVALLSLAAGRVDEPGLGGPGRVTSRSVTAPGQNTGPRATIERLSKRPLPRDGPGAPIMANKGRATFAKRQK